MIADFWTYLIRIWRAGPVSRPGCSARSRPRSPSTGPVATEGAPSSESPLHDRRLLDLPHPDLEGWPGEPARVQRETAAAIPEYGAAGNGGRALFGEPAA